MKRLVPPGYRPGNQRWLIFRPFNRRRSVLVFTQQLATLLDAGFPLLSGLAVLYRQEKDPVLQTVIFGVAESIRSGGTFSDSLQRYPTVFNDFFISMVRIGEASGTLASSLLQLAEFQAKTYQLQNKIKAALTYPIVVVLTALTILCFLVGFIVPKFHSLLPELLGDQTLPPLTYLVTHAASLLRGHFFEILGGLCLSLVILRYIGRTKRGRILLDILALQFPILGNLRRQYAISRFSRALGTLTGGGVPILHALTLVSQLAGNSVITAAITQIHNSIQAGESIRYPLQANPIFPPMVVSMIAVGEETGRLSEMLLKTAEIYDNGFENAVASLTSLLEPILIILLALIVGTIVVALFLPLISVANNFSNF